jgi:hypothetical protein
LGRESLMLGSGGSEALAVVATEPFVVSNAEDFEGMVAPSPLTMAFAW